jgi:1,4-dihydroxy-2-naphthoate octaprenyltransferase
MPLKTTLTQETGGRYPGGVKAWIQAFRLQYVPTSVLPALLGSVIAWVKSPGFDLAYFTAVILGVAIHHIALNVIDDVYDYLHAVDRSHGREKNPYTGGSGVLTGKLLSVRHMMAAALLFYVTAVVIAVYLTIAVGWPILIFVGIGLFSSVFYSAPPIRYGYRGFGELSLLINFGPVICLGAFYVQARFIAWEPFIVSLVPGFLMWSMIVVNEIPDYEEDCRAGKMNIVARLGRKSGVLLYAAGLLCAYGTMALAVSLGLASFNVLLGFLSINIAYDAFRTLNANYTDKLKIAPANLATIKVHALTLTCLIIGYLVEGVVS